MASFNNSLDAVLRNFKSIPCQAGNACTDPNCRFKHPWETEPGSGGQPKVTTIGSQTIPGDPGSEVPRKRLRLDGNGHSTSSSTVPVNGAEKEVEVKTAKKPVSPPPLKRKAILLTSRLPAAKSHRVVQDSPPISTPVKDPGGPNGTINRVTTTPLPISAKVNATAVTPSSTTPSVSKPTLKQPRKPETLYPRHLQHSPAVHTFRVKALQMLHEQYVRLNNELRKDGTKEEEKLVMTDQELIWLALDDEEKAATEKPSIYKSVIQKQIMTYKRMSVGKWRDERLAVLKKIEAAATPLKKSFLGAPREINTALTPAQEVEFLRRILTPITDLAQYKYVPVAPTNQEIAQARLAEYESHGWEVCDRCGTRFQIFPGRREEDGALASGGQCTYHSGKKFFPPRSATSTTKEPQRWMCCSETVGDSPGCTTCPTHVFKTTDPKRLAAVMQFAETPMNPSVPKDRAELLDVLVKPIGEILDLNSRYSGVWPEDMVDAKPFKSEDDDTDSEDDTTGGSEQIPDFKEGEIVDEPVDQDKPKRKQMYIVSSPHEARRLLFKLISPETPLIGHGLENDLNAMRIIHPTLIDTILLYPHTRGLPMRYSLKALMETHLNKAIQVETGNKAMGHDSAEDARAAGDLVRYKVQTEWQRLKGLGWKVVDRTFVAPEGKEGRKGLLTEPYIEAFRKGDTGGDIELMQPS
ncbi:RNA exonuclease 3 [Coniochaeta pulveracea]|uniref:RNA exonuclease 3 n=1 Tax=Coniochaeta pulveracea TaxID=177199 RepID=A0A420YP01_9PEZI|nr:RNA exonuclease 3 [Coniochaeta pulveracea]